jgi:RNA polymerase sigma-70 factor (ECF subfamily)
LETGKPVGFAYARQLPQPCGIPLRHATAQDILQETNLVLWQKAGQFEPGTNFKAWAFRIAYLQTLAQWKRQKREGWLDFDDELLDQLAHESEVELEDFQERHRALKRCLEKLPVPDYEIVRAHYEGRMGLRVLGEQMGRTRGALKQVLLRIRRTLRACIERALGRALHPQPGV